MIIEVKRGLMWRLGANEPMDAPEADHVAQRAGHNYAERFVRKYSDRVVILNAAGAVIRTRKPYKQGREQFYPVGFYGGGVAVDGHKITLHARRKIIRPKGIKWGGKRAKGWKRLGKWPSLSPVSAARTAMNLIYEALKDVWWPLHPRCEFVDPKTGKQCRRKSSRKPHHKRRRGRYLCDTTTWMATCEGPGNHHKWIHDDEKRAEARGYIIRDRKTNTGLKEPPIITPMDQVC